MLDSPKYPQFIPSNVHIKTNNCTFCNKMYNTNFNKVIFFELSKIKKKEITRKNTYLNLNIQNMFNIL